VTTSLLAFFWFFWVLLEINEKLIILCEMCCFLRTFNEFDNIFFVLFITFMLLQLGRLKLEIKEKSWVVVLCLIYLIKRTST
jgi:hypothetical protein